MSHVTLPPGTVLLDAAYTNGLETTLCAKFRIPRAELESFIVDGHFTAPLTPGLRAITDIHNVGGGNLWDPETAKSVSGIEEKEPTTDGTYRSIMANLDAPKSIMVYLFSHRG